MTTTERAVRKASRERLLRDFGRAVRIVRLYRAAYGPIWGGAERTMVAAANETSRTRYACLMTAFGQ